MKKTIVLTDEVKNSNGTVVASFSTYLEGDGSTPIVQTIGGEATIVGYEDNGSPIIETSIDELIDVQRQKFMATAIKEQKALCVENGVDPELVNIINAERGKRN